MMNKLLLQTFLISFMPFAICCSVHAETQQQSKYSSSQKNTAEKIHCKMTCERIDTKVAQALKQSFKNSSYSDSENTPSDYNKIEQANLDVRNLLNTYSKQKDSLKCDFPQSSEEGLIVLTSEDKKFRAFSWDTYTGGTLHEFDGLIQYVGSDGELYVTYGHDEDGNLGGFLSHLVQINTSDTPMYLLVTTGIGSQILRGQMMKLYQINNIELINPKAIKTQSGITDEIWFEYDASSLYQNKIDAKELFKYDQLNHIFSFPVVLASDEFYSGEVTHRKIVYQFDGQYFQRVKN